MTEDPEISEFLREYPWIEQLESALFVLRRPHWAKSKRRRKDGDARFWYALSPLRLPGKIQHSFDRIENTEFLYLYLRDLEELRELAQASVAAMQGKDTGSPAPREFKAADFFKLRRAHLCPT
jgi:hypothetical protein